MQRTVNIMKTFIAKLIFNLFQYIKYHIFKEAYSMLNFLQTVMTGKHVAMDYVILFYRSKISNRI